MWFSFDDYHTEALDRIIASNRGRLEAEMAEVLWKVFEAMGLERMDVCPKDVILLLQDVGCMRQEITELNIRRILQVRWDLAKAENSLTYLRYIPDSSYTEGYRLHKTVGRYYTLTREFVKNLTF